MYRIFIVEDDRTIAQAVAHLAESWGLEVRCVRDFRAVTAEAAEFQPHLIILDIALPCFDGYHWCRELRKQTSAPILFLSSAGDNMNVIMAMNFGADDFIAKPFDGGVLMAKVQAMLRRSYDMAAPAVLRERRGAQLSADDQLVAALGKIVVGVAGNVRNGFSFHHAFVPPLLTPSWRGTSDLRSAPDGRPRAELRESQSDPLQRTVR